MISVRRIRLIFCLWSGLFLIIQAQNNFLWIRDGNGGVDVSGDPVNIILTNETELGGFQFSMNYDHSLIEIDTVKKAGQFSNMDLFYNDSIPGFLTVLLMDFSGQIIPPWSRPALEIQFTVLESAQSAVVPLEFTNIVFSDPEGYTVPGGYGNGFFYTEGGNALRVNNGLESIPVDLYNNFAVGGVQFTLEFDPEIIALDSVLTTPRSSAMDLSYNEFAPGMVTVLLYSFAQNSITEGSGSILEIEFSHISTTSTSISLDLSDVAISNQEGQTIEFEYLGGIYFLVDPSLFEINADFSADPTGGQVPLTVQFTDKSHTPEPGGVISWQWDFNNDGLVDSEEQNPSWVYNEIGSYSVSLTVSDGVDTNVVTIPNFIRVWDFETPLPVSVYPEQGFDIVLHIDNPSIELMFEINNQQEQAIDYTIEVVSADSTYILYAEEPDSGIYDGNIWRMRPDGTEKTQITFETLDYEPVWSPDGSKIAFYSIRSGNKDIWIMDADGSNLTNLTNHPAEDSNPGWSPDGESIIFSSNRDATEYGWEIYQIPSTGGDVERLTYNNVADSRPVYSPDGNYFVTQSKISGGDWDIFIYNSDGQFMTSFGIPGKSDYQPAWSPTGKRIFWSGKADGFNRNILSAKPTGNDLIIEIDTDKNAYKPRLSPDGQFIAFPKSTFYELGGDEIFIWNRQKQRLTQITDNTPVTQEWGPEWSPFGGTPTWLTTGQTSGQIQPGEINTIDILVDGSVLAVGENTASVLIRNLETGLPIGMIPISVRITDTYAPEFLAIDDVPNDQGGYVHIKFLRSFYDTDSLSSHRTEFYTLWRRLSNSEWEGLRTIGAYGANSYTILGETLEDAYPNHFAETEFRITAHLDEGNFASESAWGSSWDNIPPGIPGNISVIIGESWVELYWDISEDEDFMEFRVYRGLTPDFNPFEDGYLVSVTGNSFTDYLPYPGNYYYVISAVDVHLNESDFSEMVDVIFLGTDESSLIPEEFALHQNYPNPFNPLTTIIYDLPERSHVSIIIYDLKGRKIKELANGIFDGGTYTITWDAVDDFGMPVSAGVYIYQIRAGEFVHTRKLVLLK